MIVQGIGCNACGDIVYSRAHHDFRRCSCGKSFVDGGRAYFRYGGDNAKVVSVDVDATDVELYDDWNKSHDKFGIVKDTQCPSR